MTIDKLTIEDLKRAKEFLDRDPGFDRRVELAKITQEEMNDAALIKGK